MLLAMLAVLAASTPAAADPSAAAAAPAAVAPAKADAKKGDDLVCKTEEVTGSRFPKKVCRHKADAERQTAEQQEQIREGQHILTPNGH